MDQSSDNSKAAARSVIAPESDSPNISSDSESVPSSPPTRTKTIVRDAHSNSWALEYPPRNLKRAVEHVPIFPPSEKNIEKENLKYIISKSNDSQPPATPRPLPMTPVAHAKGNNDENIRASSAFDDVLGNDMGSMQSEGVALEPGHDSTTINTTDAKSEVVLSSLGGLFPRLAEDRGIRSKKTYQHEYSWVDDAVRRDQADAAARMERFLAGDALITINDQLMTDLDEVETPKPKKKKKKKNKISSKKRKRLRARKSSLEGSSTAGEDEDRHDVFQNTNNATAKHTSWAGVSNSVEAGHDISNSTVNERAMEAASKNAAASAKAGHQYDASEDTVNGRAKEMSIKGPSASSERNTPKNRADEMSENSSEKRSEDEEQSKKPPSVGAPTLSAYDFNENTADEQSKLHGNDNLENAATSAEDDILQYSPQGTANETSEIHADEGLPDEQNGIADAMTEACIGMVATSENGEDKMDAPVPNMATHDAHAFDGFTEQEITNINGFMDFSNSKIELHDRLFTEMEQLIQYLVTELRVLPDLQSKYGRVIKDLRDVFTRLHDLETRARMTTHNIKNSRGGATGVNINNIDVLSGELAETGLEIFRGMKKDIKQLVSGCGSSTELHKVASRVGKCQRELTEVVKRLDADIEKYAEINSQLKGSIKIVKNDIFSLQRTSKATKSELAEVVKTATDRDENVRAIGDTLNRIVQADPNVPTLQQMSAKYGRAMKEIENVSAKCDRLEKALDYNSGAVKEGNDKILGSLDKHGKILSRHSEKLNNYHEIVTKNRDAVRGHDNYLNTLRNKANAHQKLIAKVTAQSDSNARRLHSLSDTTARNINALSESTSHDIKSITESISRYTLETFDQLKRNHIELGAVKANIDSHTGAIVGDNFFDEQKIQDIVMALLNPIASNVDKLCVKIEAYLGLLDHISQTGDGSPKPRKLSFAQKNSQKKTPAAVRATLEARQTATQPTGVASDPVHAGISGAFQASGPDIKVPKVRMPQIELTRPQSVSETPAASSPAPIAPHPSPPEYASVAGLSPPAMQILKCPELRRSSLERNERHPQDGPLPERVVAERRDSMVFGNKMEGPGMMSPILMDRVMMAPQNGYGSQQMGSLQQVFGDEYDQKKFDQYQYDQQHYDQQHHDQFGHEICYPISHPLTIIPVDENIPPAPYIPQEDPRDNHIMLLTYNVDNLNARVNEATNAMSVAQSSIQNFRTQYRYEISQEVEREVERAMGREVARMEARANQNLCRRMNNTERRVSDRTSRESRRLRELLPVLEDLLRREGMEVPPQGDK